MTRLFSAVEQDIRDAEQAFDAAPSWENYNRAWNLDCELRALYADVRPRFECTWERADNPTKGLSELAMRAYYKANAVAADCAFALRDDAELPIDLRSAWVSLLCSIVETGTNKETPKHRETRDAIRNAMRAYLAGYSYSVPVVELAAPKAPRKPARGRIALCPHCGRAVAA